MKKDIVIPAVKDVYMVAVHKWDEQHLNRDWWVYLINNQSQPLETCIVVSKGYDKKVKTSTMRHGYKVVPAKSILKVELLQEDVLKLTNEFFLTFFQDTQLFEKKFVFESYQIKEANAEPIPLMEEEAVVAISS